MTLQRKLITTYLLVALAPLFFVSLLSYSGASKSLLDTQQRSLETIADLKAETIRRYFQNYKNEMTVARTFPNLKSSLPILKSLAGTPDDPKYLQTKSQVAAQLQPWVASHPYYLDADLVDEQGSVVYSTDNSGSGDSLNRLYPALIKSPSFQAGRSTIASDLYPTADGKAVFLVIGPLYDDAGVFIGALVLDINAQEFYDIIQDVKGLGATGETLIARRIAGKAGNADKRFDYDAGGNVILFLNPLRSDSRAAFTKTLEFGSDNGLPIQRAVQGLNGSGVGLDYRGQQVLSAWRYLPESKWGLVTKIDLSEVLSSVNTTNKAILIFGIIAALFIALIAFVLARSISWPLKELAGIAKEAGEGNLNVKFPRQLMYVDGELSFLARTFSQMIINLRKSYRGLEQKVKARTSDLESAQAKTDAMLDSIGEGVVATDKLGKVLFINKMGQKLLGIKEAELAGKDIFKALVPQDQAGAVIKAEKRAIYQALKGKRSSVVNLAEPHFYLRSDGTLLPVAITATPIILAGQTIGAIEVFHDITKEAEVDKAKTEFVSLASHQLKTPISAFNWGLGMLANGDFGKINAKQKKIVGDLLAMNQNMNDLVDGLLNVSRMELGVFVIEPKPIDFKIVFKETIKELEPKIKSRQQKIETAFQAKLPKVPADAKLLHIIFLNYLSNAVKYGRKKTVIKAVLQVAGKEIIFSVSNSGAGIPVADGPLIFTKMFRASNAEALDPDGNGLGLYLVKLIATNAGGRVWFSSEPEGETVFSVAFPLKGMAEKKGSKALS